MAVKTIWDFLEEPYECREYCRECEMRSRELMDHMEILFYAYGLLSFSMPGNAAEQDMSELKFLLSEGGYLVESIVQYLEILDFQKGGFRKGDFRKSDFGNSDLENMICESERLIKCFVDWQYLPEEIYRVTNQVVEHVQTHCPHADSSGALFNAARQVQTSLDVYGETLGKMIAEMMELVESWKKIDSEFEKILDLL